MRLKSHSLAIGQFNSIGEAIHIAPNCSNSVLANSIPAISLLGLLLLGPPGLRLWSSISQLPQLMAHSLVGFVPRAVGPIQLCVSRVAAQSFFYFLCLVTFAIFGGERLGVVHGAGFNRACFTAEEIPQVTEFTAVASTLGGRRRAGRALELQAH